MKNITTKEDLIRILENPSRPVLIQLFAHWCGPCKDFIPTMEQIETDLASKAEFIKVDIDLDFGKELRSQLSVMVVPSFVLADKKSFSTVISGRNEAAIRDLIIHGKTSA